MEIIARSFDKLPEDGAAIRREVFMEEQGFVNEFDDIDSKAVHIVLYADGSAAAVCRVFYSEEHNAYTIGRIAVRKNFRKHHLGTAIMSAAEDEIIKQGGDIAVLSSQKQAEGFYQKQGYCPKGEVYLDEGCPHILMKKKLKTEKEK